MHCTQNVRFTLQLLLLTFFTQVFIYEDVREVVRHPAQQRTVFLHNRIHFLTYSVPAQPHTLPHVQCSCTTAYISSRTVFLHNRIHFLTYSVPAQSHTFPHVQCSCTTAYTSSRTVFLHNRIHFLTYSVPAQPHTLPHVQCSLLVPTEIKIVLIRQILL